MRKILLLFSICFYIIVLNSCGNVVYNSSSNKYYVVRMQGSTQKVDTATVSLVGQTSHLIIYSENGYNVNSQNVNYMANRFETYYSQMTNIYGNHTDVDGNGKIIVILTKINENIFSGSIVMGYFLPSDLIYGNFNNAEILYMDINLLNYNPLLIGATVLHEFQHLINYNVNDIEKNSSMSLWLNEALSESTSILFDDYTTVSRITEFNGINYYCFYTWDLPLNIFSNYPSASVFVNWLYQKNSKKSDIFKKIASSAEKEDYQKVLNSVSRLGIGSSWESLLTNWISSVQKGEVSGTLKGITTNAVINKHEAGNVNLYPGALVYDGSKIHVNSSTDLIETPSYTTVNISETASISAVSTVSAVSTIENNENNKNNNSINLQELKKPKYIDLVFDKDGKIKKY